MRMVLSQISETGLLDDTDEPQGKAFTFMLIDDPANIDPCTEEDRLIQRYILTVLYFATDGDDWENNDGWLIDANECNWFGID